MRVRALTALMASAALVLSGCGGSSGPGGGNTGGGTPAPTPAPTPTPAPGGLFTPPALESLSIAEVQQIIAQAAGEASARGLPSAIAVSDRVGNVLAVFRMAGAPDMAQLSTRRIGGNAAPGTEIGLQGAMPAVRLPLNLVFLIDTSGSMNQPNKLPLLKQSLRLMLGQLRREDQVAIVAYAGSAGQIVGAPTAELLLSYMPWQNVFVVFAAAILAVVKAGLTSWQGQLAGQIGLLVAVIVVIRILPRGLTGFILRERA